MRGELVAPTKEVPTLLASRRPGKRIGAILAGGKSRRMGRAKAGIELPSGLTFVEQARQHLLPHVDEIVLLGHGEGAPTDLHRIADAPECAGPISGLLSLLRSDRAAEYVVCACDMPFVTSAIIQRLCDAGTQWATEDHKMSRCFKAQSPDMRPSGAAPRCVCVGFRTLFEPAQMFPFPLWFHRDATSWLEAYVAAGQMRWMKMLEGLPVAWLDIEANEVGHFRNLNRPEELPWHSDHNPSG